jgi:hypothetical protein
MFDLSAGQWLTASPLARKKRPPKQFRRDWAAMKASLVYDERGVGRTPDGDWAYFPAAGPASEKALPAGDASERTRWMFLGFVEEGEWAREMMPGTSDEESEGGGGEGEEGEDEEMGGMGEGDRRDGGEGEEGGKGGGDPLVGVEGGVAGMVLSGVVVQ